MLRLSKLNFTFQKLCIEDIYIDSSDIKILNLQSLKEESDETVKTDNSCSILHYFIKKLYYNNESSQHSLKDYPEELQIIFKSDDEAILQKLSDFYEQIETDFKNIIPEVNKLIFEKGIYKIKDTNQNQENLSHFQNLQKEISNMKPILNVNQSQDSLKLEEKEMISEKFELLPEEVIQRLKKEDLNILVNMKYENEDDLLIIRSIIIFYNEAIKINKEKMLVKCLKNWKRIEEIYVKLGGKGNLSQIKRRYKHMRNVIFKIQ